MFTAYPLLKDKIIGLEFHSSLWRMEGDEPGDLKEVLQLREHAGSVKSVLWQPLGDTDESSSILTVDEKSIKHWDLKGLVPPINSNRLSDLI